MDENQPTAAIGADEVRAAADVGHRIAANVGIERSPGVVYVDVETAAELHAACLAAFPSCDVLVMAAAVADFAPVPADGKIKKDGRDGLDLRMQATPDVLAALSERRRPGQTLVGFAAESGERAVEYGRGKLERKKLDAVVVNDIGAPGIGFDSTHNEVTLLTRSGEETVARATKDHVAGEILDMVLSLRSSSEIRVEN